MDTGIDSTEDERARLTVVFPTFNAAHAVGGLVAAIAGQRAPAGADAARWLEAIFVDDASRDDTVEVLERALEAVQVPFPVRILRNRTNLGLAGSLNRVLETVDTEYVLTCHSDCGFGSDDYLARLVDLLDRHPDVGAIAGQSIADVEAGLSRVEKVYLTANLMDIFPAGSGELEPVGFAEGRCDGFRMQVIRAAGFYDTTLHHAGEDQVLAALIRAEGYRVCRAPRLRYYLSVSSNQDSLLKLVRHAQLFGRVTPYLILANRGTVQGVVGSAAGRNLTLRSGLRVLQLAGAASWVALGATMLARRSRAPAAAAVIGTSVVKSTLFFPYVRYLRFDRRDVGALAILQPALDLAYGTGCVKGLWHLVKRGDRTIY